MKMNISINKTTAWKWTNLFFDKISRLLFTEKHGAFDQQYDQNQEEDYLQVLKKLYDNDKKKQHVILVNIQ